MAFPPYRLIQRDYLGRTIQLCKKTATNPLPLDLLARYHEEDGRSDTRDKFRDLGAERYAAGCPVHRASLAPGHVFSARLGTVVQGAHTALSAEFPGADLVLLNVQRAFDGARLCEQDGSPANSLATPIRLQDGPSGTFVTSLAGKDKLDVQRIANTCVTHFQTCQESWHPNAAGHAARARSPRLRPRPRRPARRGAPCR